MVVGCEDIIVISSADAVLVIRRKRAEHVKSLVEILRNKNRREVIEHVRSDKQTIREAMRCLRPGGEVVIFAPNRLYPFETHGFYFGKKFIFRLLPIINYTPDPIRNIFCHHVRIYTRRGIKRLFAGLDVDFRVCTHIYPGFDNIVARHRFIGRFLQRATAVAEGSAFRSFGISHFIVAQKRQSGGPAADF